MTSEMSFGPVHFIPGANAGKYPHSNSVYIEGAGILIDAGADRDRYRALRDGPGVQALWLSHWHEDHLGCIDLFDDLPLLQMEIEAEPLAGVEHFLDWYGDRDSSIDLTIASVERLRKIPARILLTSHENGCFEAPQDDLFDRYLGVIDERENKLLDYLGGAPRTLEEIVGQCIVYRKPRQPRAFFEWGEQAIMGKHLERLIGHGKVWFEDQRYRLSDRG